MHAVNLVFWCAGLMHAAKHIQVDQNMVAAPCKTHLCQFLSHNIQTHPDKHLGLVLQPPLRSAKPQAVMC